MRVKIWGARGSVLSDGTIVVLDAGTGLRSLGLALNEESARVNILLTHLHLDHIQGIVFFAPAFRPSTELGIHSDVKPAASASSACPMMRSMVGAPAPSAILIR